MTLKIKAYSDFICPFCFLGKGPLDEIAKEKDIASKERIAQVIDQQLKK